MTYNDVIIWLNRGYYIECEINVLEQEREQALARATSITSGIKDVDVVNSARNSSEIKFVSYADYSGKLAERIHELYKVKSEILNVIDKVEDVQIRRLLELRYLKFCTFENIAYTMEYDIRHIFRLHQKSIEILKDVIECHNNSVI